MTDEPDLVATARAVVDQNRFMALGTADEGGAPWVAEELQGRELDRGIELFSRRSVEDGFGTWGREDVQPPARHRLYRATASEHFVLGPEDRRLRVTVE
jgi:hypothetical protein